MRQYALDDPYPLFTYPEPDWQPNQVRRNIISGLDPELARSRIISIPRDLLARDSIFDKIEFVPGKGRHVVRDWRIHDLGALLSPHQTTNGQRRLLHSRPLSHNRP